MQCLILAGGLGTRLGNLTQSTPKNLIPICGKPFAHYQLTHLASVGVSEIVYSIGHLGEQIRDYVGTGKNWSVNITYVDEGENLLGTGGAVRNALGELNKSFFVMYGDSYLPITYSDVWDAFRKSKAEALMTVMNNQGKWDMSNVDFQDGTIPIYAKPGQEGHRKNMSFIDYGLLCLSRSFVEREIPDREKSDLSTPLNRLSLKGSLAGYEVHQRFYEIGSLDGVGDFEEYLGTFTPKI